jgi:hypothetical protein
MFQCHLGISCGVSAPHRPTLIHLAHGTYGLAEKEYERLSALYLLASHSDISGPGSRSGAHPRAHALRSGSDPLFPIESLKGGSWTDERDNPLQLNVIDQPFRI